MPEDALYPSIIIREDESGVRVPRGRVQNRIGLVGDFSRGPINQEVLISDEEQLTRIFEKDLSPGSLAVQAALDQGARDFTLIRAVAPGRAGFNEIFVVGPQATENHVVTILVRDNLGNVAFETTAIAINAGDTNIFIKDKIAAAIGQDPTQRVLPFVNTDNELLLFAQESGYVTNEWTLHVVAVESGGSGVLDVDTLADIESLPLTTANTAYVFETGLYYRYDPASSITETLPTVVQPDDNKIRETVVDEAELRGLPIFGVTEPYVVNMTAPTGTGITGTYRWDADNLTPDNGTNIFTPDVLGLTNPGRWVFDAAATNGRWVLDTAPSVGIAYGPTSPTNFIGGEDGPLTSERTLYASDGTALWKVTSKSPGIWGNDVHITLSPARIEFGIVREVNLLAVDFRRTNQVANGPFQEFITGLDNTRTFQSEDQQTVFLEASTRSNLVNIEYLGTGLDQNKIGVFTKAIGTLSFNTDASGDGTVSVDIRDERQNFAVTNTVDYNYKLFDTASQIAQGVTDLINDAGEPATVTLSFENVAITNGETFEVFATTGGITTPALNITGVVDQDKYLVDEIEAAFVGNTTYSTGRVDDYTIRIIFNENGPNIQAVDTTPVTGNVIFSGAATSTFDVDVFNEIAQIGINPANVANGLDIASGLVTVELTNTSGVINTFNTTNVGTTTSPVTDANELTDLIVDSFNGSVDYLATKLDDNNTRLKAIDDNEDIVEVKLITQAAVIDPLGVAPESLLLKFVAHRDYYEIEVLNPSNVDFTANNLTLFASDATASTYVGTDVDLIAADIEAALLAGTLAPVNYTITRTLNVVRLDLNPTFAHLDFDTALANGGRLAVAHDLVDPLYDLTFFGGTVELPVTATRRGLEVVLEAKDVGEQGNLIQYRARINNPGTMLVLPNQYENLVDGQDLATNIPLRYGTDGPTPQLIDYLNALDLLATRQANIIGVAAGKDPETGEWFETSDSIHNALITQAENATESEGLRIAVLAAPPRLQAVNAFDYMSNKPDSRFAAIYTGWSTYSAQPSLAPLSLSPTGLVTGHISSTPVYASLSARTSSPYFRNVSAVDTELGHSAKNNYTQARMDAIVLEEAIGGFHLLNGRTLSGDPAWYWMSIRRVYNKIREELFFGLAWAKSEPITKTLIRQLEDAINNYLEGIKSQGFILDYSPSEVSATNNTVASVTSGRLFVNVYFTPIYPADQIIINLIRQPERVLVAFAI